jgi:NAD(P)-dependent dehydrogenase (short-subunit alcohol dehydrogenase family)
VLLLSDRDAKAVFATHELFDLTGKTAVITGAAGLLGAKHAEALMEYGANCLLVDIDYVGVEQLAQTLNETYPGQAVAAHADITDREAVCELLDSCLEFLGGAHILINNAARNPAQETLKAGVEVSRFETFPLDAWDADLAVGLTGSFFCAQVFGTYFAQQKGGTILNIASDLGIIAPDQRIYRKTGLSDEEQPTKPVTYSVVKTALIGLTRYLASYWAEKNVRCNALVPGGIYVGQDEAFVQKLVNLIPLGKMAQPDEYKASVVYLCSAASAYMTGAILTIDGGRTCW